MEIKIFNNYLKKIGTARLFILNNVPRHVGTTIYLWIEELEYTQIKGQPFLQIVEILQKMFTKKFYVHIFSTLNLKRPYRFQSKFVQIRSMAYRSC